jgi:hypothetical protein
MGITFEKKKPHCWGFFLSGLKKDYARFFFVAFFFEVFFAAFFAFFFAIILCEVIGNDARLTTK